MNTVTAHIDTAELLEQLTHAVEGMTTAVHRWRREADEWKARAKVMAERATKAEAAQQDAATDIRAMAYHLADDHMTPQATRMWLQLADDIDKDTP